MRDDEQSLAPKWDALWLRLGVPKEHCPSFSSLVKTYQTPPRAYHNLSHVSECLSEFSSVRSPAQHPDAVELAIWYHDAIYDPTKRRNEEASADLAYEEMHARRLDQGMIDKVVSLILATKHTIPPGSPDAELLVDIDLAILGRSPEQFDAYERAIREEYFHIDEAGFRSGRAEILQRFLDRETIYNTPAMRDRYEIPARANLKRSIENLTRGNAARP